MSLFHRAQRLCIWTNLAEIATSMREKRMIMMQQDLHFMQVESMMILYKTITSYCDHCKYTFFWGKPDHTS
ncbi:hypothetical protein KM043_017768 [Ampulex compressa]|nr:hypothetical protein KM043_017768 [Ampulex compressa]